MIPGNLDLTENLDFRAVSKPTNSIKSVGLIPWFEENKVSLKDRSAWQTSYQFNNITQTSYMVLVENDEQLGYRWDFESLEHYHTTYSISSTSNRYTISWNNSTTFDYVYNSFDSIDYNGTDEFDDLTQLVSAKGVRINTSNDQIPWRRLVNDDSEWDSYHSSIPWNTSSIRKQLKHKKKDRIPWTILKKPKYKPIFDIDDELIEDLIPWMSTLLHHRQKKKRILGDDSYKDYMRDRIPWLTNLSGYEFDAHIDELLDRDQSSYLTNLAHLGISSFDIENINDVLISI